mgnify:CR=1 FL=1
MSEPILILQKIHDLDERILEHRAHLQACNSQLQRQLGEETTAREAQAEAKRSLALAANQRRDAEREVATTRERKKHFEKKVNEVKNNTEYQALLKEIANAERTVGEWEDQILELMEKEEAIQSTLATLEEKVRLASEATAAARAAAEQSAGEVGREMGTLTRRRDALLEQLPVKVLSKYERLRESRGERAIATVADGSCSGCHYGLPPQVLNQVRQAKEILFCEGCGRFLVPVSREGSNA